MCRISIAIINCRNVLILFGIYEIIVRTLASPMERDSGLSGRIRTSTNGSSLPNQSALGKFSPLNTCSDALVWGSSRDQSCTATENSLRSLGSPHAVWDLEWINHNFHMAHGLPAIPSRNCSLRAAVSSYEHARRITSKRTRDERPNPSEQPRMHQARLLRTS